ncbi:MAG: GNAT family N-acetyltransferase [Anaerolineae bacterium]|nr:MAG: GNAT family N-acetyltransferase [Anaerolineae bacterium]
MKRYPMMHSDSILQDLSTPAVIRALEANINAQIPLMYASMPRVAITVEPDLLCVMTDLPNLNLNGVYWAAFPPEHVEAKIDDVLRRYREGQHVPMLWAVGPTTRPRNLAAHLLPRGFRIAFRGRGMAADLLALEEAWPAPTPLIVERVRSAEQLRQWFHPVTVSFEMPEMVADAFFDLFAGRGFGQEVPWRLFLGKVEDQPVAASRLFCAAGVAGIYHVATLPEARGRGLGTAMTLAAVRGARELGYRVAILTASDEGYGIYRRLGFQDCCQADIYLGTGTGT